MGRDSRLKELLGEEAEFALWDTMRHGNNNTSDMLYLRKLGDWFKKYLQAGNTRTRLLRMSEKIKKSSSYINRRQG